MPGMRRWMCAGAVLILQGMSVLCAGAAANTSAGYLIEFKNGDRLHGRPDTATVGADRLILDTAAASAPLEIRLSGIARISREGPSQDRLDPETLIYLTNGDVLPAQRPPRLQEERLVFPTSYAGELKVLRAMVQRIELATDNQDVVPVPLDLSHWTLPGRNGDEKAWVPEDGGLTSASSIPIGTDITNMPDAVCIRFRLKWEGRLAFTMGIGGIASLPQSKRRYVAGISGEQVSLTRYDAEGRSVQIEPGRITTRASRGQTNAEFALYVDRVKGNIMLYAGGVCLGRWTDPRPLGNTGGGLVISPQHGGRFWLSLLRIGPWDGGVPADPDDFPASAADRIALATGDIVTGTVESLGDGRVAVKGTFFAASFPLEQVRWLQFGTVAAGCARRNKNDIRTRLPNRGTVTFELIRLADGSFRGSSENFGAADIALDAIQAAEFDIYREAPVSPVTDHGPRERRHDGREE